MPANIATFQAKDAPQALAIRPTGSGRPPLTVLVREGDPRAAIAVAMNTEGIADDRAALVGVALAALTQERLRERGIDSDAVGGWNGWRLRALVSSPADAGAFVDALRAALLAPVNATEPALAAVARRASALARRPLRDAALADLAGCTGEAYSVGGSDLPTAADLERWRGAAHGLGRAAIAVVGDTATADAAANSLARGPAWPFLQPAQTWWPGPNARAVVYDASGQLDPGAARIFVTARTTRAERAVEAASALGGARGPLASRLAALEARGHLNAIVGTAHASGGCLAVTVDLSAADLAADSAARIATAASLAREEIGVEIRDVHAPADLGRVLASGASDPREAAERAAWWSLTLPRTVGGQDDVRLGVIVGVAAARDVSGPGIVAQADSIRREIDRATLAWHTPVVEGLTRVERGQGEAWLLLASPCGTFAEATGDAGVGAAVAFAAGAQASAGAGDAIVEPFVAVDGIGLLVHGPARGDETPQAHARRLADLAARTFAADALDEESVTRARTLLLRDASEPDARALGVLAAAVAPGHPSWFEAAGTSFGLASVSDDAIELRSGAIRNGPLRVAVVANADQTQADAAVQAVDRWVARGPGDSRSCPASATSLPPRPGTYAVDRPAGSISEALVALPIPADAAAHTAATWIAAALDGADGLLGRALGANPSGPSLAENWSAAVRGDRRSEALVIRIVATDDTLDSAVAQTRALLDRLHQGGLRGEDCVRASLRLERSRVADALDPRTRVVRLWRGAVDDSPPALEALRAFVSNTMRDEGLVIVAARPARTEPSPWRGSAANDPKPGGSVR
jgi:hypothetical protein